MHAACFRPMTRKMWVEGATGLIAKRRRRHPRLADSIGTLDTERRTGPPDQRCTVPPLS
jgi:hypothetical protein